LIYQIFTRISFYLSFCLVYLVFFCCYRPKDVDGISPDDSSYASIKLNNDLFLYLKQVNKFLAFVCVIRDDVFSENRGNFERERESDIVNRI
jgi:hypothetical protein